MTDGFSAEVRTLRTLSSELASIGERVGAAQDGMASLGDGQTGDGGLTAAGHHFTDRWEHSLKKVRETAEKTAAQVTAAADGYQEVDGAVGDAAAGRS